MKNILDYILTYLFKKTTKKYATEKSVTYFDFFIKNIII